MSNLIYKAESYSIIGACMEVYNNLGPGFLESVYHEALYTEFRMRDIDHELEPWINVIYKGKPLKKLFRADFLCYEKILVEIKAVKRLAPIDEAVAINYLKATKLPLILLVNFGEDELVYRRFILT